MSIPLSLINRFALVRQIPAFSKLGWLSIRRIAKKSNVFECKKHEIIRREGDPPDGFYCVVSGRVQAYTNSLDGKKQNVEFLHRGMYFGIISLFSGEGHSQTFEAINDSIILKINKEDFHEILNSLPQLGIEFSQTLSQRIRRNITRTNMVVGSTIISIYSPLKGAGSSTYAINLALSLQKETGKKVIFVNVHPKNRKGTVSSADTGEASPQWKNDPANIKAIIDDINRMKDSIVKNELKIDLLNIVFDMENLNLTKEMGRFVSGLAYDYNYVVVDLPNEMDDVILKTLTQSDVVQLICAQKEEDLQFTADVIQQLRVAMKENFHADKIQVILSGREDKNALAFEEAQRILNYEIYTKLAHINPHELNVAVVSKALTVITCDPKSEYAKSITRIAREIGGVLTGLVLGGGAALGVAHIGVIRVLEKENIPIDIVAGSSMGALIGSLWVAGKDSFELEKVAREFQQKKAMWKLIDPPLSPSGLVGGAAIKRWLRKHLGDATFYNTRIPIKVIAYDLIRREDIVIHSGSLVDAVRKSISIPGVIPPIRDQGQAIIDGGVLNPLPTNVLKDLGINRIIAVNVLQSPEHSARGHQMELRHYEEMKRVPFLKSPVQYISTRLGRLFSLNLADIIVRTLQATEYVIAEQNAKLADVFIHPNLEGINWYELYRVDDLIKAGEEATYKALPRINALIKNNS